MESMYQKAVQFLKECVSELKKVTWLSKKEVVASTIVLSLLVGVIAIYVGILDFLLSKILGSIL